MLALAIPLELDGPATGDIRGLGNMDIRLVVFEGCVYHRREILHQGDLVALDMLPSHPGQAISLCVHAPAQKGPAVWRVGSQQRDSRSSCALTVTQGLDDLLWHGLGARLFHDALAVQVLYASCSASTMS